MTLVGLEGPGDALRAAFGDWIDTLFAPASLPTVIPRLVLFAILIGLAALAVGLIASGLRARARRRTRYGMMWRLLGSPLSAAAVVDRSLTELWNLIRGAAPLAAPPAGELARRYVELLSENLGQPGFRELLVIVHDMDVRRDFVFALLGTAHRQRFFGRPGAADSAGRAIEMFDLSGVAREHALDALAAALALPVATEPHLTTFSAEGPWRGETHRLCDRPGAIARLLEEVGIAGAEQVILVSPPPRRPARTSSAPDAPISAVAPASSLRRSKPPASATRSSSSADDSPACSSSVPATTRSARWISRACTTSDPTGRTRWPS